MDIDPDLYVSRDRIGGSGKEKIQIPNILFLEWSSDISMVIVHMKDGAQYYLPGALIFWGEFMTSSGFKFVDVDRSNWVNTDNVQWVETDPFPKVCFGGKFFCPMRGTKHRLQETVQSLLQANPCIAVKYNKRHKWSLV
ncbi:LytTR family transcriptional regulator DNA-binding domain-containing protein [Neobacillus mesonae]|nr:LytTR family transcriptional regulator DNA-binding domain-containing protein [Neobacillus mesonae]